MENTIVKALKKKRFLPGTKGESSWVMRGIEAVMTAPIVVIALAIVSSLAIGCGAEPQQLLSLTGDQVLEGTLDPNSTNTIPDGASEEGGQDEPSSSFFYDGLYSGINGEDIEVELVGENLLINVGAVSLNIPFSEFDEFHRNESEGYKQGYVYQEANDIKVELAFTFAAPDKAFVAVFHYGDWHSAQKTWR